MNKVLIVEDDPIVAHIYRSRLEKEGYEVDTAADGQAGFYRIHEFHPDAVLLDLMLPKMNGIDILKKIRAQGQFQHVPIIVFTNAYVPNMIQEAFGAGASQVFNKSTLTPRQIIDALQALFLPSGSVGSISPAPSGPETPNESSMGLTSPESMNDAPFHSPPPPAPAYPAPAYSVTPAPPAHGAGAPSYSAPPVGVTIVPKPADQAAADDESFQSEMFVAFTDAKPAIISTVRKALQDFSKAQDDNARLPHLLELYRRIHALTGSAGIAGFSSIAQMAAALEVLLKELHEKPKNLNASTLRTVAHSVDFIAELFNLNAPEPGDTSPAEILVVDDEILSRRAITYALEKANLKAVSVEDPNVALNLASEHRYDLIFLDVQMPGMDGFELCTKIRSTSPNKQTTVIFVTSLTDFKSRAKSSLSGGNDLIAKPFMFIELSVKALTQVLRGRLGLRKQAA